MSWSSFRKNKWVSSLLTVPKILFTAILVWMIFFSEFSCLRRLEYNDQIKELKSQISSNMDSAAIYDAKARELDTDRETLEKIAREKYGMKRIDEDVYVTDIP